ncbi:MAG TPA: hypothetical protein VK184_01110 [Nostocaceae cyanobacterium]|nr:hypothetical protein [Nostocaceae cyanobacterium]
MTIMRDIQELLFLCQEGIKSGKGKYKNIEEIKLEARRRFYKTAKRK